MKTWNAKPGEVDRKWWLVDADGQTVGRMASKIAQVLRGKNKPQFTPHVDTGDFVVVINTDKMRFTGAKWDDKKYYTHSRYIGSLKEKSAKELLEKDSTKIVTAAVKGMLPKNKMASKLLMKMKTYTGAEHPHAPQKPETLALN